VSDVVSTSTDTLTRGQDHPGGVQVALCGESTVHAPESSHRQGDLGPLAQPPEPAPGLGEQPAEPCEGGALSGLLLVDCFVPEEPAPVPLRERRGFRLGAGAPTVGVTHCLEHMYANTHWRCVFLVWMRPDRSAASCPAAGTTSGGTRSTGDPSSNAPSSGGSHKSSVRCARRRTRRSSSSRRCPTRYTFCHLRSVRHPPPRQGNEGPLVQARASGVPVFAVSASDAVDQFILRRHCPGPTLEVVKQYVENQPSS